MTDEQFEASMAPRLTFAQAMAVLEGGRPVTRDLWSDTGASLVLRRPLRGKRSPIVVAMAPHRQQVAWVVTLDDISAKDWLVAEAKPTRTPGPAAA